MAGNSSTYIEVLVKQFIWLAEDGPEGVLNMGNLEVDLMRSMLLSIRIKASPEAQSVKEKVIDKTVEQFLFINNNENGLTIQDIKDKDGDIDAIGLSWLLFSDIQSSLERLCLDDRVTIIQKGQQKRYKLSDGLIKQLTSDNKEAIDTFNKATELLFSRYSLDPTIYRSVFFECLCTIFSKLGEAYVRMLKNEISAEDMISFPNIQTAIDEIISKHNITEKEPFKQSLFAFFKDSHPLYDKIKWNMAQNYYLSKVLSLDPGGLLLSKELFGNSFLYLDTNILLNALDPNAKHYKSFEIVSRACKQLNICLQVCQITLDEMVNVVESLYYIIEKVENQIPEETLPNVGNSLFQTYLDRVIRSTELSKDGFFELFLYPMKELERYHEIELIDDDWFSEAKEDPFTIRLAQRIKTEFLRRRRREKTDRAAMHDALLFRWINIERERRGKKAWIVTLDTTLPVLTHAEEHDKQPSALLLDALLQWVYPVGIFEESEEYLASFYSEVLKYQLLPQDIYFDLQDFLIFADMEWSCKELPAEDVENCIRYLKQNASHLNPNDPADREKIHTLVSKYFVDPSRKYKHELESLEKQITDNKKEADEVKAELDCYKKRESARKKIKTPVIISLTYLLVVTLLINLFGTGENIFQKLLNSWQLIALLAPIYLFTTYYFVGKELLPYLGKPYSFFSKDKDKT